jgi:hypothetical protein
MKSIVISGPDGTGKSSIIQELRNRLQGEDNNGESQINVLWLRFNHYTAKIINMLGRVLGKSYRETYEWGIIGYHNYEGFFGRIYITAVFFDHMILDRIMTRRFIGTEETYLIDRYILDIAADLIVDTCNPKYVFQLFDNTIRFNMTIMSMFILECPYDITIKRRPDIIDDKKYASKVNAYKLLADKYDIKIINTGILSINESIEFILE